MDHDREILERAEKFLREEVAPHATEIDVDPEALRRALTGMARAELLSLRRPVAYGGPEVSEGTFRQFQEAVARYSGALAFLQTQHQSAGSMISKSDNEVIKQKNLPKMANGERLIGIGFSQLRRKGEPIMRAEAVPGGYVLNGHVPWATGWSFFQQFLIGATLPSGDALFALVPFASKSVGQSEISVSEPMRLAAMETPMTVTVDLRNWRVPQEEVVFVKPADWIANNDMINITLQGHFALGCARAGLDILQSAAEKKGLPFLTTAYDKLSAELEKCREATAGAPASSNEESTQERLDIRAWAIQLAVRCAHAAVTASSGAANSVRHPAQRVYREALVYTVSAQTTGIMEATLARITGSI
jgi:alkylation response protein AidB-like acyl-CoA dehydrogenase